MWILLLKFTEMLLLSLNFSFNWGIYFMGSNWLSTSSPLLAGLYTTICVQPNYKVSTVLVKPMLGEKLEICTSKEFQKAFFVTAPICDAGYSLVTPSWLVACARWREDNVIERDITLNSDVSNRRRGSRNIDTKWLIFLTLDMNKLLDASNPWYTHQQYEHGCSVKVNLKFVWLKWNFIFSLSLHVRDTLL
jgi:hypothetical protein